VGKVVAGGLLGGGLLLGCGIWLIVYGDTSTMECRDTARCDLLYGALILAGYALALVGFLVAVLVPLSTRRSYVDDIREHAALRIRLQQAGVPALARIVSIAETRLTWNDAPLVDLVLDVAIEGRPAYQVRQRDLVPRLAVGRLTDGRPLTVLVDPARPDQLVVDWLAQPHPATTGP